MPPTVETVMSGNDFSCKCGHDDMNHCLPDRPPSCHPAYLIHPIYGDFRGAYERSTFQPFHQHVSQLLETLAEKQRGYSATWEQDETDLGIDRVDKTAIWRKGKRWREGDEDGFTEILDCAPRRKRRATCKYVACTADHLKRETGGVFRQGRADRKSEHSREEQARIKAACTGLQMRRGELEARPSLSASCDTHYTYETRFDECRQQLHQHQILDSASLQRRHTPEISRVADIHTPPTCHTTAGELLGHDEQQLISPPDTLLGGEDGAGTCEGDPPEDWYLHVDYEAMIGPVT